jgi:hemerythrin-like domain-containing protein
MIQIGTRPPPGFDDPVGLLTACHRRIEERLATLERAVAGLRTRHPDAEAALNQVVEFLGRNGGRHTEDEEGSLFPRLTPSRVVSALTAEHRAHEAILVALRAAVASRVVAEIEVHAAALCAAYRDHIRVEEAELFPLARALDPAELRAVGLEMQARRGPGETE